MWSRARVAVLVVAASCGVREDAAPPREASRRTAVERSGSPAALPASAPTDQQQTGRPEAAPAPAPPVPPDLASVSACTDSLEVAVFRSPRFPHPGQPLRFIVVSERPQADSVLEVLGPDGAPMGLSVKQGGGPPYWWVAEVARPRSGAYKVGLGRGADVRACEVIRVGTGPVRPTMDAGVWPSAWKWERDTENFYSAWVEHLFDAGVDQTVGWRPLHEVLRDRSKNLLFGHLSLGEDEPTQRPPLVIAPDCADTPFALRAYFAWKMQLPFGFRACTRGGAASPPHCGEWSSNQEEPAEDLGIVGDFGDFLRRRVSWTVHSGSGRTLPDDDDTDLYPLALTRENLRPGAVFADPYGHFLVLAKWVDQTPTRSGILFAIDGQPDGSIGRKRFWRGNFLFHADLRIAGAGWKAFRPIGLRSGVLRPLTNGEIASSPQYGNYSDEQYRLGIDGFYERMERLLNPSPVDPARALTDVVDALREQLEARVRSVRNGEDYMTSASGRVVSMPEGPEIFETTGAWEDYATPSRDMRVLIAIQVLLDFPERIVRQPDFFAMPAGKTPAQVRGEIVALRDRLTGEQSVRYDRTDGSQFTLTLAEILSRRRDMEMAYNPNDCVEHRWAAPEGSAERSTCGRHAPSDQVARMESYRSWFATRTRPPRP
ncbi:MAG: hypothetical protein HYY06_28070 [Deltaproteobacteria bacterium]|nr:hypothetical protein [Deltaproteobacteria bacterium]